MHSLFEISCNLFMQESAQVMFVSEHNQKIVCADLNRSLTCVDSYAILDKVNGSLLFEPFFNTIF